mgnify:CR=1 FL=1
MNSSAVLHEMRELRETWRKQLFKFTNEQQKRYDALLVLRRARVKEMLSREKDK